MAERITELELVLPALLIMNKTGFVSTSTLQIELPKIFNVTGEYLKKLEGRGDNKFSQKVRNLKSHNKLENLGFAIYSKKNNQFEITKEGKDALEQNKNSLDYLIGNHFEWQDSVVALNDLTSHLGNFEEFDEDIVITEGSSKYTLSKVYERSHKLRSQAIEYYSEKNNGLFCDICDFDFKKTYGKPATGYIEMHHLKPVYMYKDEDEQKIIDEAISNLIPVCANCHRVIHRTRPPYQIEEVKGFYQAQLSTSI